MDRFPSISLSLLLIAAGVTPSVWAEPIAEIDEKSKQRWQRDATASLLAPSSDRIWVKVRHPISIETLATSLRLSKELLAKLNDVSTEYEFREGDWLIVPSNKTRDIKQIAGIDSSQLRRTPPLENMPPLEAKGVVRFGDTLIKLAQRYGLTLQELLRLNPGLETARLVAGTQIELGQSTPGRSRMVLGLKPTTSGGASWPELPNPGKYPTNSGVSATGLVGPFKRTPASFARFLNSRPRVWEDPSLRTYFYDLYSCYSYAGDSSNIVAPSYRCDGGYVSYSDNLGQRRCRLRYVSWNSSTGQKFEAYGCR